MECFQTPAASVYKVDIEMIVVTMINPITEKNAFTVWDTSQISCVHTE